MSMEIKKQEQLRNLVLRLDEAFADMDFETAACAVTASLSKIALEQTCTVVTILCHPVVRCKDSF
jgi:hypothetical protein